MPVQWPLLAGRLPGFGVFGAVLDVILVLVTATDNAIRLAKAAGTAALDKLGTDIVLIDVSDRLALTDVFVIVTGRNERQVEAIVDEVEQRLLTIGAKPLRQEGRQEGSWVLLDFGDVVVHVQHTEQRVFYALERLWGDCPRIEFPVARPNPASEQTSAHPSPGGEALDNGRGHRLDWEAQ